MLKIILLGLDYVNLDYEFSLLDLNPLAIDVQLIHLLNSSQEKLEMKKMRRMMIFIMTNHLL